MDKAQKDEEDKKQYQDQEDRDRDEENKKGCEENKKDEEDGTWQKKYSVCEWRGSSISAREKRDGTSFDEIQRGRYVQQSVACWWCA